MVGAIHGHAQHGDPMVQDFMGRLLRRVCSPLFEMVRSWVLEGELEDVFGEFFIVGQPVKAESLWREGYLIQSDMLPICYGVSFLRCWHKGSSEQGSQSTFSEFDVMIMVGMRLPLRPRPMLAPQQVEVGLVMGRLMLWRHWW